MANVRRHKCPATSLTLISSTSSSSKYRLTETCFSWTRVVAYVGSWRTWGQVLQSNKSPTIFTHGKTLAQSARVKSCLLPAPSQPGGIASPLSQEESEQDCMPSVCQRADRGLLRPRKHVVRSCNQTNPQLILTHGETLTNRYSLRDRESDCENRSNKSMNARPDPILFAYSQSCGFTRVTFR